MYLQYRTLYERGPGRFEEVVGAIARDAAMLVWLDGRENRARAPNENFARELFELFTLGHFAHNHANGRDEQPYTERDVKEAARALTGWTIDPVTYTGVLRPELHDAGTKKVLGHKGAFGLDDLVRITTAQQACAPHVVARLWSRIGRPAEPGDAVVEDLAAQFAADQDVTALLRRMLLHDAFRDPQIRSALVKMPIEYVVGTLRALRVPVTPNALQTLVGLGQVPFFPPDVSGWPNNGAWLSTSSAQVRLEFALDVAKRADVQPIAAAPAAERPAVVGRLLGVDAWGDNTAATLADAASDPRTVLTLALVAPEYQLN
jgi:uncharacterized protein (DUF1800 family)